MKKSLHVLKFGGTSMGTAQAMQKAANIVRANPNAGLVVLSAMSGVTNQLLQAYWQAVSGDIQGWQNTVNAIQIRHFETGRQLSLTEEGWKTLGTLEQGLCNLLSRINMANDPMLDQILSLGERMSSVLFTHVLQQAGLKSILVDARDCIRTDDTFGKAEPQILETERLSKSIIEPLLDEGYTVVTQGFIGSAGDGRTTTLGRGGSDFSAALFAEALDASACEIWTDVSGILTMDPRVVPEARVLPDITFAEAAELANFGAKVLHPATIQPALRRNIKVFVGNTFAPEKGGTWIHPELESKPLFRAVALREKQTLLTVSSMRMLNTHGFLAKLFSILANHGVSVDLVTTSEVSVTLTIDGTAQGSSGKSVLANEQLMKELKEIGEVVVEENLSLLAVIGNRLSQNSDVAVRAFNALKGCNVRLVSHGASAGNICLLINGQEAKGAASRLHNEFL